MRGVVDMLYEAFDILNETTMCSLLRCAMHALSRQRPLRNV